MIGRQVAGRLQSVLAIGLLAAASVPVTLAAEAPSLRLERAQTATEISGVIAADATWRKADSPVVLTGQTIVDPGVTLTIEPGVEVRVRRAASLWIRGALLAIGTAEAPISISADDGIAGSWPGIEAIGGADVARVTLRHAEIAHGGGSGGRGAQLYGYFADLDLEDVTVRDGAGQGVVAESAGLRMLRVAITGNAAEAVWVTGLHTSNPAYVPAIEALRVSGNGLDVVAIQGGGGFSADAVLPDLGVPYEIRGQIIVASGATLRLEPGTEIRFAAGSELVVNGHIEAAGTVEAPIVFRGVDDPSGSWYGISILGGQEPATGRFEHVTIRGAGQSGRPALKATNAQIGFLGGAVTDSGGDGILIDGGGAGTSRIEGAAITGIAGIGLRNDTTGIVLAQHDWWGAASGPSSGGSCSGTGSRVEGKVRFAPWLTAADQPPDPFAVAEVPTIELEPQRWYAPANSLTRVWIDMTVRDPLGRPLPGRTVDLRTTLGAIVRGETTDAAGRTLAFITSDQPGDAQISATLVSDDPCELSDPVQTLVTFTETDDTYLAGVEAPYFVEGLEFDPEPVVQGVPTVVRARLLNTNSEPIRVEAEFGYASFGLGLTFGPIGSRIVQEIPAGGEATFETTWVPPITGHYCLQIQYHILGPGEATGTSRAFAAVGPVPGWDVNWFQAGGGGSGGSNVNVRGGGAPALQQWGGGSAPPNRDGANKVVGGMKSMGFGAPSDIIGGLFGDPPRQDYTIVAPIERLPVVYWPREAGWSDARWAAEQAVVDAIFEYTAIGRAALVSLDRYGGAAAAGDLTSAAVQAASIIHYRQVLGAHSLVLADRVGALADVIERESPGEGMTLEAAKAELDRLRATGFTAEERAFGVALGLDEAGLERALAWSLDQTPEGLAGRTADQLRKIEAYHREISTWLAATRMFPDDDGPTAAAGGPVAAASTSELARIVDETVPFEVGNPLDHEATIELRVRPLALPAGWAATVSPPEVTLAPGAQITATVTISPSGPAIQGTIVKVAVEGLVDGSLLGGVVVGVLVPEYVPFEAPSPAGQDDGLLLVLLAAGAGVAVLVVLAIVLLSLRRRSRRTA